MELKIFPGQERIDWSDVLRAKYFLKLRPSLRFAEDLQYTALHSYGIAADRAGPVIGLVVDGIGEFARVDAALALHPADLPAGILPGLQRHAVAAAARGDGSSIALSGFPIADDWLVGQNRTRAEDQRGDENGDTDHIFPSPKGFPALGPRLR